VTVPSFSGIGGRSGIGDRPALLVIDMSTAFTDPASQLACDLDEVAKDIARLLEAARSNGRVPVIFTTVAYGERERVSAGALLRKMPAALVVDPGSYWTQIDPRVEPRPNEPVFTKVYPSAFFGTTLASYLIAQRCDSVIVTGASTSGCVRATVVDAVSHGFYVAVPRGAVGDRLASAHEANLVDIDLKYGDVISTEAAVAVIHAVGAAEPPPQLRQPGPSPGRSQPATRSASHRAKRNQNAPVPKSG
jgi:nicotinamidase-related amidase